MILQWPAPAKLNLFLYITGRRPDGYHLLQTLFQFLDYSDIITIKPTNNSQIRLLNPISSIDKEQNLVIRAAKLLQCHCKRTGKKMGADIWLNKRLPIGSGLGGGSSDAATTLMALNIQWQCGLNMKMLSQLGLILGADIPIFIYGKAAIAEGIGENLTPVIPLEKWYLVSVPKIKISTKLIFNDPNLQSNRPKRSIKQLLTEPFYNVCEPITKKKFPIVEQHILWLLKYAPSRLTGTGAGVFAEFHTESAARQISSLAPKWMHSFVAQGVNISPLHRILQENMMKLEENSLLT